MRKDEDEEVKPKRRLPPELLPRILCYIALRSPADYLSCLLTCKEWSAALSEREQSLVRHNFLVIDKIPQGRLYQMGDWGEIEKVNLLAKPNMSHLDLHLGIEVNSAAQGRAIPNLATPSHRFSCFRLWISAQDAVQLTNSSRFS